MKYKCIKSFDNNLSKDDIVIISNDNHQIYNITKRIDIKYKFDKIKDYLVNITDEQPIKSCDCSNKDEFIDITNKLHDTYLKKNFDYGNSFNKTLDFWGLQAAGIRMSDKLERFNNIVKNGSFKVKDESIIDTLEDLATYAIMTVMYLQK